MPKGNYHPQQPRKREEFTAEDKYHNVRMDPKVQREWIDRIKTEAMDRLDPFETNFVINVDRYLRGGIVLTETQAKRLESIYANRTN